MARTTNQTEVTQHITNDADTPGLPTMADAWNELAVIEQETNQNAIAVARQLGYDGTLSVGALEDEIRFYQRRTVEGVLELGKRLLVLQELTPHGEFMNRVSLLGIDHSLAKKFMKATWKFAKLETFPTFKIGSQSKLLELLVLDDGEIEALESGESVRGVTLDKIETMSVSELKKALRDANERIEAKDQVIKDKSSKIDQQAEQIAGLDNRKQKPISADQALIDARSNLQITAVNLKMEVASRMMQQIKTLMALDASQRQYAAALIIEVKTELDILIGDFGLPSAIDENPVPEWMRGTEFDPNKAEA
ncbi:hypothetical protein [Methylomonas sp. 11b]|uniref:hypothetical protein n=1 Tax=Methylomonas sp. 11b TaxID=1168169 RepID=UPI0012DFE1A0|nr:hypothetical protein [Methylomonas sp. 11b]